MVIAMVAPAMHSLSPLSPAGALPAGATAALLRQAVCQMVPLAAERPCVTADSDLSRVLDQLIAIVMTLRSPTAGWPAGVTLTPELLAPYISEEVWNLLDRLGESKISEPFSSEPATAILPVPSLIPRLLWMLASSGYEAMHLVEGGRATVQRRDGLATVSVVRLVPVLTLTTDQGTYALDLVTQADPSSSLWLAPDTQISLLDHDLDSAWISVEALLTAVTEVVAQAQPQLHDWLTTGKEIQVLCPFQTWQWATLRLHLYVADMGVQGGTAALATAPQSTLLSSTEEKEADKGSAGDFTLDDFANFLIEDAAPVLTGILGDWLTFTDEDWVRRFLYGYARQILVQGLPRLAQGLATLSEDDQELACAQLAYQATQAIDGPKAWFKHTFVQAPALVSDVWPRFRWYLAQSSERVMQLMGGLPAQVLSPGRGWQQGILSLRPLMQLVTDSKTWIIDLGNGRLLPTTPLALPEDAVIETTQAGDWANHQTIAALIHLVEQDVSQYAPAMAELAQGTAVHLRCLDTEEEQIAQLTLCWCFTWAYGG